MASVPAFHSKKQTDVYHTCSNCTVGDNIEPYNKVSGTGGLRKCSQCVELESKGKC